MTTLGVEEEYLLLDERGVPTPRSEAVLAAAGRTSTAPEGSLQKELLAVQVEVATPVCTTLADVREHLCSLRGDLAQAARRSGCLLAPVAAAPVVGDGEEVPVSDVPRYRDMLRQAPALVEEQLINGMHVHVGVPDRATGLRVVAGVRAWLPLLLAISANSPFWRGRDSGFASWRGVHFARWPAEGPPPVLGSVEEYEEVVEALLATGAVRDRGQLYWHARLSDHLPTVEVRVADVQLDVDTAVLLAGLVRALADTALLPPSPANEPAGNEPAVNEPSSELLRAATWQAARWGLDGDLVDPRRWRAVPAREALETLVDHVRPALEAAGDLDEVEGLLHRVLERGTGAARQRAAVESNGLRGLLDLLTL
jgi:carboxylate-amine ligase